MTLVKILVLGAKNLMERIGLADALGNYYFLPFLFDKISFLCLKLIVELYC